VLLCHAARVTSIKLGAQISSQSDDWPTLARAARRADDLGYDYLFMPDHLTPLQGPEDATMFEGITGTTAIAATTQHVKVGLLVGSNTFRNPTVLAKSVATIDHISNGRAILGLGGGWHAREHEAWGVDFGRSAGERLDWLDEALSIIRPLLSGETVTHAGNRYRSDRLYLSPQPVQDRLPIMVGGVGEKKTLRTVARFADIWNAQVGLDGAQHKIDVLRRHCDDAGRDIGEIELSIDSGPIIRDTTAEARAVVAALAAARGVAPPDPDSPYNWVGSVDDLAERILGYTALGFTAVTCSFSPPYDEETMTRLIREVKPLVDAA
jgi:alkanesulfonate monooxygenase SsuD/methylene tetrahydromethanopterin reductase-like flavin-dependent oxidoreductase (luciferase family)